MQIGEKAGQKSPPPPPPRTKLAGLTWKFLVLHHLELTIEGMAQVLWQSCEPGAMGHGCMQTDYAHYLVCDRPYYWFPFPHSPLPRCLHVPKSCHSRGLHSTSALGKQVLAVPPSHDTVITSIAKHPLVTENVSQNPPHCDLILWFRRESWQTEREWGRRLCCRAVCTYCTLNPECTIKD
jgi:hypothetical protein